MYEIGHVENTIETVLANIDNDPQDLIRRLKDPSIVAERIDADEELAKQLSQKGGITESAPQNKAKNTTSDTASEAKISDAEFTLPRAKLPSDFLRIPGYKHRSSPSDANLSDEQLAWMLQDKDLENHLKQREVAQRLERMSARSSLGYPGSRSSKEGEGPNIMKHLSRKWL